MVRARQGQPPSRSSGAGLRGTQMPDRRGCPSTRSGQPATRRGGLISTAIRGPSRWARNLRLAGWSSAIYRQPGIVTNFTSARRSVRPSSRAPGSRRTARAGSRAMGRPDGGRSDLSNPFREAPPPPAPTEAIRRRAVHRRAGRSLSNDESGAHAEEASEVGRLGFELLLDSRIEPVERPDRNGQLRPTPFRAPDRDHPAVDQRHGAQ